MEAKEEITMVEQVAEVSLEEPRTPLHQVEILNKEVQVDTLTRLQVIIRASRNKHKRTQTVIQHPKREVSLLLTKLTIKKPKSQF